MCCYATILKIVILFSQYIVVTIWERLISRVWIFYFSRTYRSPMVMIIILFKIIICLTNKPAIAVPIMPSHPSLGHLAFSFNTAKSQVLLSVSASRSVPRVCVWNHVHGRRSRSPRSWLFTVPSVISSISVPQPAFISFHAGLQRPSVPNMRFQGLS